MKELTKRERCVTWLDHWQDIFAPTYSGNGPGEGGDNPVLGSLASHASVKDILRQLERLRAIGSILYPHLRAFYGADTRLVDRPTKIRNAHGKLVDGTERVRERVLPPSLKAVPLCAETALNPRMRCCEAARLPRTVCRAVGFVVVMCDTDLELPLAFDRKLREYVNTETGEPGWTEAA